MMTGAFVPADGESVGHGGWGTRIEAGGVVFVPRGVAHTFATAPGADVTFLAAHPTGGFEDFHREVARVEQESSTTLAPPQLMQIAVRYDWELAGPSMFVDSPQPTPTATER